MTNCRKCGKPISFKKEAKWIAPIDLDGNYHKCRKAGAVDFIDGPEIIGPNYVEAKCNCVPWEGCEVCCPPNLTDADVESLQAFRLIG